jgi:hypothetical protein
MLIKCLIEDQEYIKSPFEKGGFRGISDSCIIPPDPPLKKGGIKRVFLILKGDFSTTC